MAGDSIIIKKVLKGEIQYFSELVEKYEIKVYKTCYKFTQNDEDARDLCQEVFIKIYNNLERFMGTSSLSTWIYRISVNTCLNFLRANNRLVLDNNDPEKSLDRNSENCSIYYKPEDYVKMKEKLQLLDLSLEKAGKRNRKIFIYRLFHGMPFKEIAKKLGIRSDTARVNFSRTRKLVKQTLEEYEKGE